MLLGALPLLCSLALGILPGGVRGALDDRSKLANRTIDRNPREVDVDYKGWLWSRLPITAHNFVVEVEFKISGEGGHLFGDGLAVWLTSGRAQPGPVFGNIDQFNGLGIFLDTYANSRHSYSFPRIIGMLGDGKTSYDHGGDGDSNALGACSANFRRTNVATKLKITYLRESYLNVKIQYKAWDEWTDCFTIPGLQLPDAPYLGFSAETGDVFDNHDIISVTTVSAILSAPDSPRDKIGVGRGSSSFSSGSGGFFSLLFKIALVAAVCYGAFFGYKKYYVGARGGMGGGAPGFGQGVGAGGHGGVYGGMPSGGRSPMMGNGFGGGGMFADAKRF